MRADDYNYIIKQISNPYTMSDGLVQLRKKLKEDEMEYNRIVEYNSFLRDASINLSLQNKNLKKTILFM